MEDEVALLREAGHEVTSWTPSPGATGPLSAAAAGASAVWSRRATAQVRRLVASFRPDAVHVHNLFPMLSPAVLRQARAAGARVVMTLHNYRLMCLPADFLRDGRPCELCLGRVPWRGVRYRCYRDSAAGSLALATSLTAHRPLGTFAGVDRYLAVSDFVRRKHVEGGLDAARITVKPNFSWPTERREGPGEEFFYLGRLSPEKGVATLVAGWRDARARLVVVGDGPEASRLREMAPANVEFRPPVPGAEIPALIRRARAVVVPSICYEGGPRIIAEAAAAGVPVIASRIGGLSEALRDGDSGLLVRPGEPADWAPAAERLADDGESLRLGENAYRLWQDRYRPERTLELLEEAYRG